MTTCGSKCPQPHLHRQLGFEQCQVCNSHDDEASAEPMTPGLEIVSGRVSTESITKVVKVGIQAAISPRGIAWKRIAIKQ